MNLGGSIKINRCGLLIITSFLLLIIYYMSMKKSNINSYAYSKNTNEINLRKLLIGSIQAAEKGGVEVLLVSKDPDFHIKSKGLTKEGINDPVTDADFKSNCVMQNGLHRIFPKLNIISEEDATKNKCPDSKFFDLDPTVLHETITIPDENVDINDVTVWIDPLDATKEYTEKLFDYVTTMVCVAVKGQPVIGVIHNPFTLKTTWAWSGKAVSEDLTHIKKDDEVTKTPIIVVSRSHAGDVTNVLKKDFGDNTKIISAAGAGYKVLQVIQNNATAYVHTTRIKKWDICAGNAILNAVGGQMTNLLNSKIDYSSNDIVINDNGILATMNNHDMYVTKIVKT